MDVNEVIDFILNSQNIKEEYHISLNPYASYIVLIKKVNLQILIVFSFGDRHVISFEIPSER